MTIPGASLSPAHASGRKISRYFSAMLTRVLEWQERSEQRHLLAAMDDRMLKDIGVNALDAQREANKPFWKA
jgi:uncharacterized protein YjiS (DUF1127 family)